MRTREHRQLQFKPHFNCSTFGFSCVYFISSFYFDMKLLFNFSLSRSIPRARRFGSSTWRASIIPQSSIPHSLTLTQSHRHRIRSLVNINECAMKRFLFDFIKQSHCDLFASLGSPFKMHRSFDSLHTEYQPKKHR